MFCVEVTDNEFELFRSERAAEVLMIEMADAEAGGLGKEAWCNAHSEIYTEWVNKCEVCKKRYVLPNSESELICDFVC